MILDTTNPARRDLGTFGGSRGFASFAALSVSSWSLCRPSPRTGLSGSGFVDYIWEP